MRPPAPRRREPPLVALTGYGQACDVAAWRTAGFADHLVKPAELTAVLDRSDRLTVMR